MPHAKRDEPVLLGFVVDRQPQLVTPFIELERAERDDERRIHGCSLPQPCRASHLELAFGPDGLAARDRNSPAVCIEQLEPKPVFCIRLVPGNLEQRGDEEAERSLRVHHRPAAADHVELAVRHAGEVRDHQSDLHAPEALQVAANLQPMSRGAYLLDLGLVPYREAWDLQRSLAGAVSQGAIPDTVVFLEHPPVVTLGRRADTVELHVPPGADVEVVETDRGGKSTFHGPGQLVCYPILDLNRHGKDVKKYVRDLEEALIRTMEPLGVEATRIEGLTGVWLERPPRKIASIGVHISRWVTTHGYALNVDLDPTPFTEWITACGLEDTAFTTIARELGRPVTVDEVRPFAREALADVFGLVLEQIPAEDGHGLWNQPIHRQLATR